MTESRRQWFDRVARQAVSRGLMTQEEVDQLAHMAEAYREETGQWPGQNLDVKSVGSEGEWVGTSTTPEQRARLQELARGARSAAQDLALKRPEILTARSFGERDEEAAINGALTLKTARNPASLTELVADMLHHAAGISAENEELVASMLGDECAMKSIQAEALWAKGAFPFVQLQDPKWAASLMATSIPPELAEQFESPWPAFRISIPQDLLTLERAGDADRVGRIMVMREEDGTWTIVVYGSDLMVYVAGQTTANLCEDIPSAANKFEDPDLALSSTDRRCLRLVSRLVLGVCLAFDRAASTMRPKRVRTGGECRGRAVNDPILRRYILGRPVTVDARGYVRAYLSGETRGPVSVQSWIRGHWKSQPHGPGGTLRKFIHVEPYWRGPEDAPIAVRPHVLKGAPSP